MVIYGRKITESYASDPFHEMKDGDLRIYIMYKESPSSGYTLPMTIPYWRDRLSIEDIDTPEFWMEDLLTWLTDSAYNWRR